MESPHNVASKRLCVYVHSQPFNWVLTLSTQPCARFKIIKKNLKSSAVFKGLMSPSFKKQQCKPSTTCTLPCETSLSHDLLKLLSLTRKNNEKKPPHALRTSNCIGVVRSQLLLDICAHCFTLPIYMHFSRGRCS